MLLMLCCCEAVIRERDELVALLNARERRCFGTLSLVGQKDDDDDLSANLNKSSSEGSSHVTAVKVRCY